MLSQKCARCLFGEDLGRICMQRVICSPEQAFQASLRLAGEACREKRQGKGRPPIYRKRLFGPGYASDTKLGQKALAQGDFLSGTWLADARVDAGPVFKQADRVGLQAMIRLKRCGINPRSPPTAGSRAVRPAGVSPMGGRRRGLWENEDPAKRAVPRISRHDRHEADDPRSHLL